MSIQKKEISLKNYEDLSEAKKEEVDNLEENNQGEIKIEDLYSDKTLKVLKKLINPEDDIQKIIHKREIYAPYYLIHIKTVHFRIDVISGLGSGYYGTGAIKFNDFLTYIGLHEKEAEIVFDNTFDNAVIEFNFTNN